MVPANEAAVETSTALGGAGEGEAADDTAATQGETTDAGSEAAPEKVIPETYELTAPEGTSIDPADLEAATPIFKELGLDNDQASKLLPVAAAFAKRAVDNANSASLAHIMEQRNAWLTEAKADKEYGGNAFDANVAIAAKGLDGLGFPKGSPLRNLLDESGLGNHPEMIRAWVKVGKAIGEDPSFERTGSSSKGETNPARILYPNDPPKGA